MSGRQQGPGPDTPDHQYISLGNDVIIFANPGAPVDGTSGTMAGVAGPGSVCLSYSTSLKQYINGGTKASPTWKLVTSAA